MTNTDPPIWLLSLVLSFEVCLSAIYLVLKIKVSKKERGHLALLLLHVGRVDCCAKANVQISGCALTEVGQEVVYRAVCVLINTNGPAS